jgi:DNA-binding transcriptional LysR family regulator
VGYLYEEYVASHIADGRLVSLLDESALPVTEGFFMFYPSRRQNPAALRVLIEFLRSELHGTTRATALSNPAKVQSLAASATQAN